MTDAEINAYRNRDWPSDCQTCPARQRCDELARAEPPEEEP